MQEHDGTTPPPYDVLIVGMGPVGAMAAIAAGRAGLRTCVVEQAADVYPLPRAVHFDAEIMRLFQRAGLAPAVEPIIGQYRGGVHLGADGEPIRDFRVPAERGPLGWYPHNTFLQPRLERVLRTAVADLDRVDVRLGWTAEKIRQDDDGVDVTGRTAAGVAEALRARWVIACDGASSTVRKQVGIRLTDYDFNEPWIIIDAVVADPDRLPDYSVMWCDPARPGTYVPLPGSHRRWEFMLLDGETAETMGAPEKIAELVARSVDIADVELVRSAVYRFHGLIAERWRAGRVFLAGDAAHQTPPFYGQGMCHGIRDVTNLVWKLELAERDPRFLGLLDTYGLERHPHVRTVIDASVENGRYICVLDPEEARLRDERLRARAAAGKDVRSFRSVIPGLVAGLVQPDGEGTEAGQLMPQPTVKGPDGAELLLDEVLGDGFALLTLDGPRAADDVEWFTDVLDGRVVGVDETVDATGELRDYLAANAATAVLVRPDRYVYGFARGPATADDLLAELRDHIASYQR
ncbi:bifunctional 3-(3-hydroxy-phenyl)propionate/3-hydroxycinnamic acid hydroxylase [Actinocorallia sp. A-T 12471]|uniref:bifunctional 3-(3-hydroxy-phenyl)propionate/3-hydroxycinnamic acid hydroxylase n=1 Tax=Actinocorallia sp. A-T 12471 TaxID=3089813 RepID=UPI0029D3F16E|nr:bifunctional 3-(3-hydroxy-phenyl)propionate/3-hydroxycinnamic acid hydroxylase [Actinocorallia sp. A-T 12471]MDX6741546.1 bifunctional 3-(3-hydroxy-phenyl)propionate/3-hydroxycinnamic acid hydroxylase [Actinocorallia sp. A-T 12471]